MHRLVLLGCLLGLPAAASVAFLGRSVATIPTRVAATVDTREFDEVDREIENVQARTEIARRREAPIRDKVSDRIEELASLNRRLRLTLESASSDLARARDRVAAEAETFLAACMQYDGEQARYDALNDLAAAMAGNPSGQPIDVPDPPDITQLLAPGGRFAAAYQSFQTESQRAGIDAREKLEDLRSRLLGVLTAISDLELELMDNASTRLDLESELQKIVASIGSYARGTSLPIGPLPTIDLDASGLRATMRAVADSISAVLSEPNVMRTGDRMLDGHRRISLAVQEFNRRIAR